jgi:hypothetical protein
VSSTEHRESPALPVGLTLDRGFALLRHHPRALLVPQLVLNLLPLLAIAVLVLLGIVLIGDVATTREVVRESTFLGDSELVTREVADYTTGQTTVLVILVVIGALIYAWFLIAALVSVVRGADRALEGREHLRLRPAMRDALRETPKLFGVGIVFYLLVIAVVLGTGILVAIVAAIAGPLAILVGLAAFLALVWAGIRVFLWPFVHLSEHAGLGSFGRAWRLSKGRFWPLLAVLVLVAVVVGAIYVVVSIVLQLLVVGAASLSDEVGIVALVPYALFSVAFGLIFTAGYVAPLAVAYRTLAGRDTADLWQAAGAMGSGADLARPAPEPGVRRWDAAEEPLSGGSSAAGTRGTDGSGGFGGLPDPAAPSDAERLWGRGTGDEPRPS